MNKDTGIGFAIGFVSALILCIIVAVGFALSKSGDASFWENLLVDTIYLEEGPLLDADFDAPDEVVLNQAFTIEISVSNPHDVAVTLDNIGFADSVLEGMIVEKVDPTPSGTYDFLDTKTYEFNSEFQPGETGLVRFTILPTTLGSYSGDIDVCNPEQDFHTFVPTITVVAPSVTSNSPPTP